MDVMGGKITINLKNWIKI